MVAWPGKQDREGKNVVENSWVRIRTFWLQKAEGQQCMESSLDRGKRGKDAQGSTVPSDVWSAKSNGTNLRSLEALHGKRDGPSMSHALGHLMGLWA